MLLLLLDLTAHSVQWSLAAALVATDRMTPEVRVGEDEVGQTAAIPKSPRAELLSQTGTFARGLHVQQHFVIHINGNDTKKLSITAIIAGFVVQRRRVQSSCTTVSSVERPKNHWSTWRRHILHPVQREWSRNVRFIDKTNSLSTSRQCTLETHWGPRFQKTCW